MNNQSSKYFNLLRNKNRNIKMNQMGGSHNVQHHQYDISAKAKSPVVSATIDKSYFMMTSTIDSENIIIMGCAPVVCDLGAGDSIACNCDFFGGAIDMTDLGTGTVYTDNLGFFSANRTMITQTCGLFGINDASWSGNCSNEYNGLDTIVYNFHIKNKDCYCENKILMFKQRYKTLLQSAYVTEKTVADSVLFTVQDIAFFKIDDLTKLTIDSSTPEYVKITDFFGKEKNSDGLTFCVHKDRIQTIQKLWGLHTNLVSAGYTEHMLEDKTAPTRDALVDATTIYHNINKNLFINNRGYKFGPFTNLSV